MSDPYIVVNEYDGLTGHTNISLYDANGGYLGTYGANVGDVDLNPLNGFEGGIYEETDPNRVPINTTTYSVTQENFDTLYQEIQSQVSITQSGDDYYFLAGANCIDTVSNWLNIAEVQFDLTDMFVGTLLDMYATARYWLTESIDWLIEAFDPQAPWDEEIYEKIDEVFGDFYECLDELGCSDIEDQVDSDDYYLTYTQYSPIAIDLNGDGLNTTSIFKESVKFDLDGNGTIDKTAWLDPNDAFIAIDINKDGIINSGAELFGGSERGEGYKKLSEFDTNSDGILSIDDEAFNQLLLWQDKNSNGVSDDGELVSIIDSAVESISVVYESYEIYDNGNMIGEHSTATIDSEIIAVGDIYFLADLEAA